MPDLLLCLFGTPQFLLHGKSKEISVQKAIGLLAYLAVTRVAHRRESLATLFWPDYPRATSRTYLRQALHELTGAMGHRWFNVSREEIGLVDDATIQSDVHEFRRLVNAGDAATLQQAVALYRGDFLAGFSLPDCPEFEQWQLVEMESLRNLYSATLQSLIRWYTSRHEFAPALELGLRWLALDAYHEPAHRNLMQLYAWTGQHAAALRQYEECKRLLRDDLQTAPDPETEALYHAIRQKQLPVPPSLDAPNRQPQVLPAPSFLSAPAVAPRRTPFVARERELRQLAEAMDTARHGVGQILFVIGGAGRGKTSLVQEFARRVQAEHTDLLVVSGTCNAYTGRGDPYLPFREMLVALAGDVEAKWAGGHIPTENARRLWEAMPTTLPVLVDVAPDLLCTFVQMNSLQGRVESFAPPNAAWLQQLRGLTQVEQQLPLEERQLFAQFTDALQAIAEHYPLLLILEDLHWIDAASNNLLLHLSRMLGQSRILVIGTYRPNELMAGNKAERHPLATIVGELKRQHGDIWLDLGALSSGDGQAFVDAYLDTQPHRLNVEFRRELFRHTGGHALFTVELLREMQTRGDLRRDDEGYWVIGKATNWSLLPSRVEGVIEQRISRLENHLQNILTVASIEGESFTAEVLAHVQGQAEYDLVQVLSQELDRQHRLVTAESVARAGQQRLTRYRFRHHLFQQYLYNRLHESERAYLHEKVGHALEALYGERAAPVAILLAHHFEQAGMAEKAIIYLRQAGQHAHLISANREALQLLTRALELLTSLPPSVHRDEQELALRLGLGRSLKAIQGLGSQEAREANLRAYELCARVGSDHDRFAALHGLFSSALSYQMAFDVLKQMLQLADNQPNPIYRVSAYHLMGHHRLMSKEYATARSYLEQSIALYEPRHHHEYALLCGQDEGIAAMANLSATLWHLGYPDQALQRVQNAVTLAEELAHPITLALARHFEVLVHLLRGEVQIAYPKIDALAELANEHGFGFETAVALLYRGQAFLMDGQVDEATAQFVQAQAAWRTTNFMRYEPFILLQLVIASAQKGQFEQAQAYLREAESVLERVSHVYFQDILHRVKGELFFALARNEATSGSAGAAHFDEAEAAFMQALQLARKDQDKSRELQTTLGLCQMWMHQGKLSAAHAILANIYNQFTEGFGTRDLREAQALLETLSDAILANQG